MISSLAVLCAGLLASVVKTGVMKVVNMKRDPKIDTRTVIPSGVRVDDVEEIACVPIWCSTSASSSKDSERILAAIAVV